MIFWYFNPSNKSLLINSIKTPLTISLTKWNFIQNVSNSPWRRDQRCLPGPGLATQCTGWLSRSGTEHWNHIQAETNKLSSGMGAWDGVHVWSQQRMISISWWLAAGQALHQSSAQPDKVNANQWLVVEPELTELTELACGDKTDLKVIDSNSYVSWRNRLPITM